MHIEHYAEFIVLTEELNFHTAAERLHISQSALSKHIAELERHHHVQLLERDRSSVRLTAKGAVFLEPVSYTHLDVYKRQGPRRRRRPTPPSRRPTASSFRIFCPERLLR